jgi:hypothetical protein
MKYVPPFDKVKELLEISTEKGELYIRATYDNFVVVVKLLLSGAYVDDAWYLQKYPDVARAIDDGQFDSAKHHFIENGYFEGRFPCEPAIDEGWYLKRYPDVAESVKRGDIPSALRHFVQDGYREGRLPFRY